MCVGIYKLCANLLPEGKLPIDVLKHMLDSMPPGDLVVPRGIGIDVAITKSHGKYLVSSSDPITGAKKRMGWYAVNVSANDVATSGIMPDALNVVVLLPKGTRTREIQVLLEEINSSASELGITIGKGHTEITPGLDRPIVMVTMFGSGDRFVTSADAQANDAILMTKTAGIEGASILAGLPRVRKSLPRVCGRAERLIEKISVLEEAKAAFKTGKVHAMHDVTEGGVIGAVSEMALASGKGFELHTGFIPVDSSTKAVCSELSLDPLRLIGSGALLVACPREEESRVRRVIEGHGIKCTRIGRFVSREKGRTIVGRNGSHKLTELSVQDELWPALEKYGV